MPKHRQKAQAVVELAIIMPILLWCALGALDFGRVFYSYIGLVNAARDGARYATFKAPTCDLAGVKTAVQNGQSTLNIPAGIVTLDCSNGAQRTVAITNYQFDVVTPFIANLWGGGPLNLSTTATLPIVNKS
jgi:Flp pilus assembly protein TadG